MNATVEGAPGPQGDAVRRWAALGASKTLLTRADVVLGAAYEALRPRLRPQVLALKTLRRVPLTGWATLSFECRRTAWSQAQEELRFFPDPSPRQVDEVVARANDLVPQGDLRATLFIHGDAASVVPAVRAASAHLSELELHVAGRRWRATALDALDHRGCLPSAAFVRFCPQGPSRSRPQLRWPVLQLRRPLAASTVASLAELTSPPRRGVSPSTPKDPPHVQP